MVNQTTISILVPYQAQGYRFSVEFNTQLVTTYNTLSGSRLWPTIYNSRTTDLIPSTGDIYYPTAGSLTGVENINHQIIYFQPGVYYMGSNYVPMLSPTVQWIYLAPGAYVKGSFAYQGGASWLKITGFGVLSGEQYAYMPDRNNGFNHALTDKYGSCVKLLQFFVSSGTSPHLDLHGVTIMEPPFNSFIVYANSDSDLNQFSMSVSSYHQVGAWYWQTDGLELYANSNSFFHANDDVIKLFHSDSSSSNVVIWKGENGPVFQFGWIRAISRILASKVLTLYTTVSGGRASKSTRVSSRRPSRLLILL
ncbi:glycoside hydrolase [Lipomyces doorenjongii]